MVGEGFAGRLAAGETAHCAVSIGRGLLSRQHIFCRGGLQFLKLQFKLIKQPRTAFRGYAVFVAPQLGDLKLEFLDQRLRATHRRADLQKLAVGGFSAGRLRISARCLSSKGST